MPWVAPRVSKFDSGRGRGRGRGRGKTAAVAPALAEVAAAFSAAAFAAAASAAAVAGLAPSDVAAVAAAAAVPAAAAAATEFGATGGCSEKESGVVGKKNSGSGVSADEDKGLFCLVGMKEDERAFRHFLFPRSFILSVFSVGAFGKVRGVFGREM